MRWKRLCIFMLIYQTLYNYIFYIVVKREKEELEALEEYARKAREEELVEESVEDTIKEPTTVTVEEALKMPESESVETPIQERIKPDLTEVIEPEAKIQKSEDVVTNDNENSVDKMKKTKRVGWWSKN